jgi:hypothetical protein
MTTIKQLPNWRFILPGRAPLPEWPVRWTEEMPMPTGLFSRKPPGPAHVRPFEKGRSGKPASRVGCRNKTTSAAEALLAGESERRLQLVEIGCSDPPPRRRRRLYGAGPIRCYNP